MTKAISKEIYSERKALQRMAIITLVHKSLLLPPISRLCVPRFMYTILHTSQLRFQSRNKINAQECFFLLLATRDMTEQLDCSTDPVKLELPLF